MLTSHFREYRSEVGRERQIPALVELLARQTRPPAVHLSPFHRPAKEKHRAGVAMVGASVAILPRHATELRHRQDDDVAHAIAEVCGQCRDGGGEVAEAIRELASCAALVDVRVPTADVGEPDLEPHVRLDELRDLHQSLTKL